LRRSRSRPLLMQYNITMLSILWKAKASAPPPSPPDGLAGLLSSIKSLVAAVAGIVNLVKGIVSQVTGFITTATGIFQSVTNLIKQAEAIPNSLLLSARACAQAGATMFSTIANISGNTTTQSAMAMSIASSFSNIQCLLQNAVNKQQTYPDYSPLYGASDCSSTNGGSPPSPYAGTNPFYAIVGAPQNAAAPTTAISTAPAILSSSTPAPVVTVSPAAHQALAIVNNSDPVLAPMSISAIGTAAGAIATGITIK